jgi:competence protein ComEC
LVPLFATVGTGPLIAHYFGHLSLAGFIANPLIVPLVGFVVVPAGLLVGFLAVVTPAAAAPLAWFTEYLLALTLWLVRWLAELPLATIRVPAPNAVEVVALYAIVALLFSCKLNRASVMALACVTLALGGDVYYWWRQRWHRAELRVTHLNVGQGDAAVVEFPGSKVMLIDAGGTALGGFDPGESIVAPFLRSRKILKVDYLVLTHARIDHYGGMRAIIEQFAPAEFWSSASREANERLASLDEALANARVRRVEMRADEPCRLIDAVRVCVLYAPADDRDGSAVLGIEHSKLRYLFAGDIDKREETILLRQQNLRSAVLKVPRHGSANASTPEFLDGIAPKLAVVSAGARGRFEAQRGEVSERYRRRGAEVLRTDRDGAIAVRSDGKELRYQTYKSRKRGAIIL